MDIYRLLHNRLARGRLLLILNCEDMMSVELCLLLFCSIEVNCIPVEEFFPFGASAGDVVLDLGDDDYSDPIPLSPPFPLLGEHRTSLRVSYATFNSKVRI